MVKNKIYEMILKKYKVFSLEDTTIVILEFENESKSDFLTGLLIEDSVADVKNKINNLVINSKYNIRGNVINLNNDNFEEFDVLVDDNKTLRQYLNNNEIFQVLSIKKVNDNPKIKSLSLSIYYNEHSNDRVDISIPIESVNTLSFGHITTDIEYVKDGDYVEFIDCDDFRVEINRNDIRKKDLDVLLDNITITSVSLFFDNGELISYNMPWCSDDGVYNKFQEIYSTKDLIRIIFDGRYKK